jgi:hypothetical protein
VSQNTFSPCAAGLGLMSSLGTVTVVNAAADDLEEIIVTGSHIRGVETAGSKLIVIGREQIDASGYGRVENVVATAAQNFGRANAAVSDSPIQGSTASITGLRCDCRACVAVRR